MRPITFYFPTRRDYADAHDLYALSGAPAMEHALRRLEESLAEQIESLPEHLRPLFSADPEATEPPCSYRQARPLLLIAAHAANASGMDYSNLAGDVLWRASYWWPRRESMNQTNADIWPRPAPPLRRVASVALGRLTQVLAAWKRDGTYDSLRDYKIAQLRRRIDRIENRFMRR